MEYIKIELTSDIGNMKKGEVRVFPKPAADKLVKDKSGKKVK